MSPIGRFGLAVVLWLPICYAAWYFFSIIFTVPLGATLDALLTWRFPQMFSGIEASGNTLMVTTALTVEHSDPARAAVGLVRFQVHALDYGYSVPLYTALVLAAPGNPPEKLLRWMLGVCILFVVQVFGVGTGSENKVPFIGAVSLNEHGHPLRAKFTRLPGFTRTAVAAWTGANLAPTSTVISDGLACFAGVTDIGCTHQPTVVGTRKPKDLPMFRWVNTILGNLKTGFSGAYHSFDFGKYAERCLGAIAYRFNRRFDLQALPTRLLAAATACGPRPEPWIRRVADVPC